MEFKKPETLKRHSDEGLNSPCNRKKSKLLSTTIATPNQCKKETDPFDDNFSQFFRSQFIRQISEAETSIIQKSKNAANTSMCDYNFTQIDGLSQFMDDTQFDTSITSGQRFTTNESNADSVNEEDGNEENILETAVDVGNLEDWKITSRFEKKPVDCEQPIEYREDFAENEPESQPENQPDDDDSKESTDFMIQSSQAFLKELSMLQTNISSLCNETINASKFGTQDFLHPDQCQFEVYKSHVTASQYMHRKHTGEQSTSETSSRAALAESSTRVANTIPENISAGPSTETNTEMIEDQLLAEMVLTTQGTFDFF